MSLAWIIALARSAHRRAGAEHSSPVELQVPSPPTPASVARSVPVIGGPWEVTDFMDTLPLPGKER